MRQGITKSESFYDAHLKRTVRHDKRSIVDDPAKDTQRRADALRGIISKSHFVLNQPDLIKALGSTSPDLDAMRRIANGISEIYVELLDWAQGARDVFAPRPWESVYQALSEYADLSIERVREFVADVERQAGEIAEAKKAGKEYRPIKATLVFDIGDAAREKFNRATRSPSAARSTARTVAKQQPSTAGDKRRIVEAKLAKVEQMNRKLSQVVDELDGVLLAGLSSDPIDSLNNTRRAFAARPLDPSLLPPNEATTSIEDFLPQAPKGILGKLPKVKRQHRDAQILAQKQYEAAVRQYEERRNARDQRVAEIEVTHKAQVEEERVLVEKHNKRIDDVIAGYISGDRDGIATYFQLVLASGQYPSGVWQSNKVAYVPDSKQLVIEHYFPTLDVIPAAREYKYVQKNDRVQEIARPARECQSMYLSLISQIALRVVREVFAADKKSWIESLVFNGHVSTINPGTGQVVTPCLVSLRVTRDSMEMIDLSKVDPVACLKTLNAGVSKSPSELIPVRPVLEFSMVDPRFVQETDVLSELDQRPNLMELTPSEFESLITNLFGKMGLETRLTKPSRDGGVDCVAYDLRPVLGGKVVIQAKRYKNTVGVSAVRDLFGTVHNEGASKGILVTTSGYGKSSFDFANGKPLELFDGSNLLHLLSEYAGIEAKIEMPEDWVDPVDDDGLGISE